MPTVTSVPQSVLGEQLVNLENEAASRCLCYVLFNSVLRVDALWWTVVLSLCLIKSPNLLRLSARTRMMYFTYILCFSSLWLRNQFSKASKYGVCTDLVPPHILISSIFSQQPQYLTLVHLHISSHRIKMHTSVTVIVLSMGSFSSQSKLVECVKFNQMMSAYLARDVEV